MAPPLLKQRGCQTLDHRDRAHSDRKVSSACAWGTDGFDCLRSPSRLRREKLLRPGSFSNRVTASCPPHCDPLMRFPGVLALGVRPTRDLYPRAHTFAPSEGHRTADHLPFAGLVAVAVADLELHRKDRDAGGCWRLRLGLLLGHSSHGRAGAMFPRPLAARPAMASSPTLLQTAIRG